MDKYNKRVALITGATGGLGTAMCKKLHDDGFRVVGNFRNKAKAEDWIAKLHEEGYDIDTAEGDVCNYESMVAMVQTIENRVGPHSL